MRASAAAVLLSLVACAQQERPAPGPKASDASLRPAPEGLPDAPARPVDRGGMLRIPGGSLRYAPREGYQIVLPVQQLEIAPFWLDATEVTNRAFEEFVVAVGYVTEAEHIGNAAVFDFELGARGAAQPWTLVDGANWRHPEGPESTIQERMDHPVVQVSWNDAQAYARWRGKRLPSDAEWEYAARGGLSDPLYPWGNELAPEGVYQANYWQGLFPVENQPRDGWPRTAPAAQFPPNGYGLFDMAGNVWEWTASAPVGAPEEPLRSVRGGSYLCREAAAPGHHPCAGYRVTSRQFKPLDDGNSNVGFRCAADD